MYALYSQVNNVADENLTGGLEMEEENKEILEPKFNDHRLSGNYSLCRECHIGPDFLLIYQIYDDINLLILIRVGSHSELFK